MTELSSASNNNASSRLTARVNYEDVKAVPYRRTLTHVNNFVISTTQFLNRFSFLCEEKLAKVSRDIQRLEIVLAILEAKLQSIPGIENAPKPEFANAPAPINAGSSGVVYDVPPTTSVVGSVDDVGKDDVGKDDVVLAVEAPTIEGGGGGDFAVPAVADAMPSARTDPRVVKFFKMQQAGVPLAQVQLAMRLEGLDPSVLETGTVSLAAATQAILPPIVTGGADDISSSSASTTPLSSHRGSEVSVAPPSEPPPPPVEIQEVATAAAVLPPVEPEDPLAAAVARRARKMAEMEAKGASAIDELEKKKATDSAPAPFVPALPSEAKKLKAFAPPAPPPVVAAPKQSSSSSSNPSVGSSQPPAWDAGADIFGEGPATVEADIFGGAAAPSSSIVGEVVLPDVVADIFGGDGDGGPAVPPPPWAAVAANVSAADDDDSFEEDTPSGVGGGPAFPPPPPVSSKQHDDDFDADDSF